MSGKAGLAIGLLVGVILAVGASLTVMVVMNSHLEARVAEMEDQLAEAYKRGQNDAVEGLPKSGARLSADFNQGLMEESRQLHDAVDTARTRLQAVQERDDLTPAAREELTRIIEDLPE